jgi:membrane-bound lytic murein transglycosylase F
MATKISCSSLFCLFLLVACSKSGNTNQPGMKEDSTTPQPIPSHYSELGDLDSIKKHGKLRLIAPRFDGADALPREGFLVQNYQRIAEEFANSLKLDAEWLFVDGFDELIPMLESGQGDLIVTNFTQTEARKARVDFTAPINKISEVIVGPKSLTLSSKEDLHKVQITVPDSTAYVESLQRFNSNDSANLHINIVQSNISDYELLDNIANGQMQATVLDSNVAQQALLDYPDLKIGYTLRRNRPLGWAVRKNSPQLLEALNIFLVSHFLSNASYETDTRDWAEIKKHGRIRMLTLNNPASYFMWRGELMGFDYELVRKFSELCNLHMEVVVKNSIPELITALQQGEGDLIAASLTPSTEREAQGIQFTRPYLRLSEQLIGRENGPYVDTPEKLAGFRLGLNPNTVFFQKVKNWQQAGINIEVIEYPDTLTEQLFDFLIDEKFDFMLADSHLTSMEQAYRENLKINFNLSQNNPLAWAVRSDQDELVEQLNKFIASEYRGLFYNITFNKYFVNQRKIISLKNNRVSGQSGLSPYDDIVKQVSAKYSMDWRLITAQMFQESRFDPSAKSFAGALGLMQVLPRTAQEFGYTKLLEPKNGIEAGIAYLNWLADRFPGDIDFQERLYFQLAAYNAGAGHVRDARRLAAKEGYDSNRWFDQVEKAMLLLAKPEYHQKSRFGYVRGSEPVAYVREIRDRYLAYLNATQ